MNTTPVLNISLEPHLRETLAQLPIVLPTELSQELISHLGRPIDGSNTIPYDTLDKISFWSRTAGGQKALHDHSPPLDPHSYSMIALLAGTRTSPEKNFPVHRAIDPDAERRRAIDDKKAISAVINAIFSVAGTGVAAWWASAQTGLRIEWRAILAVCAALVVALAEIILYVIWDSRRNTKAQTPIHRTPSETTKLKREDDDVDNVEPSSLTSNTGHHEGVLRQRIGASDILSAE
ncbi:hypothetical protein BJ138DRAFT_521777 [Hygrophoropsis aurantiaca]|uniref:Uncharacterized protein n=1 Tax=Hygrophoropsis aurantiaca TaxID=72124 RepID=A0ACB8A1N0_9AGAM|nr:hypothetical protein BJ138DRAFT_521777 [Hygrophoropsis aurantiaca]